MKSYLGIILSVYVSFFLLFSCGGGNRLHTNGDVIYESDSTDQSNEQHSRESLQDEAEEYRKRAMKSVENGQLVEAEVLLTKAINLLPEDFSNLQDYFDRGNLRMELGRPKQAIDDYSKAIDLGFANAYYSRATAKLKIQDFDGAYADFSKSIKFNHRESEAYLNRGVIASQKGDLQAAVNDYSESIRIRPSASAYNNRGVFFERIGKFEESIQDHTEAIKLEPSNYEAYLNRSYALLSDKQYQQAILDCQKAVKFNPNNARSYFHLGVVYGETSENEKAIEYYGKAIELDSNYANAYFNRAIMHYQEKHYTNATKDLEIAERLGIDVTKLKNEIKMELIKLNKNQ